MTARTNQQYLVNVLSEIRRNTADRPVGNGEYLARLPLGTFERMIEAIRDFS